MSSAAAIALKTRQFDPLDHFDYGETDLQCSCTLCEDWRAKLSVLQGYQQMLPKKECLEVSCHPDLKGPCPDCRLAMKSRMIYLAALNRRDLYSECSFHGSMMENAAVGRTFMRWIRNVIDDRKTYPDGWWTNKAPFLPLQFWITMFKQSVISGMNLLDAVDNATTELPKAYITATGSNPVSGIAVSGFA